MSSDESEIDTEAKGTDELSAKLIPVINKLRDVLFLTSNSSSLSSRLQLPQIVVVGCQSSGKSSVLEGIVGRDFLPRGSGIVTRRPLVLQLFHSSGEEYGVFTHKPEERFTSFNSIKEEIEADTKRLVGDHSISPKPINLKIFSPNVPDLTLVDLPGVTKVPTGKQPSDIAKKLKQLVINYISNPNTIILAVTPANQDLANSDSIQIAQEVDPAGLRTIGVLTKLDLMDRGTNCVEILLNNVIPLKLGYIGVINRSQQDINEKRHIKQSLEAEEAWIRAHAEYVPARRFLGTPILAAKLSDLLVKHIKSCLPALKGSILSLTQQTQAECSALGTPITDRNEWMQVVMKCVEHVSSQFHQNINGATSPSVSTKELNTGARIAHVFHDLFFNALDSVDPALFDKDSIRIMIQNVAGPTPPLFVPQDAFELLVKQAVGRLEEPCLQAVGMIYTELMTLLDRAESSSRDLLRFGKLRDALHACMVVRLQKGLSDARELVTNLVAIEKSYVSTYHPQFVDVLPLESLKLYHDANDEHLTGHAPPRREPAMSDPGGEVTVATPPSRLIPPRATVEEDAGVELVSSLLQLYFGIVKAKMQDLVPKAIMCCLVNTIVENMDGFLLQGLLEAEHVDSMMHEDEDTAARRESCKSQLVTLKKAEAIVRDIGKYT